MRQWRSNLALDSVTTARGTTHGGYEMDLDRLVENRHGNGWYRYVRELTWKIQDKTE